MSGQKREKHSPWVQGWTWCICLAGQGWNWGKYRSGTWPLQVKNSSFSEQGKDVLTYSQTALSVIFLFPHDCPIADSFLTTAVIIHSDITRSCSLENQTQRSYRSIRILCLCRSPTFAWYNCINPNSGGSHDAQIISLFIFLNWLFVHIPKEGVLQAQRAEVPTLPPVASFRQHLK